MTYLILAAKFWRECIIVFLAFLLLICLMLLNSKTGQLKEADSKYIAKIQEIEQKHLKVLAAKQDQINKVSSDYEAEKSKQRVKVEMVTREVQKIIERPVYNNVCSDGNGLQSINSLIKSRNSS